MITNIYEEAIKEPFNKIINYIILLKDVFFYPKKVAKKISAGDISMQTSILTISILLLIYVTFGELLDVAPFQKTDTGISLIDDIIRYLRIFRFILESTIFQYFITVKLFKGKGTFKEYFNLNTFVLVVFVPFAIIDGKVYNSLETSHSAYHMFTMIILIGIRYFYVSKMLPIISKTDKKGVRISILLGVIAIFISLLRMEIRATYEREYVPMSFYRLMKIYSYEEDRMISYIVDRGFKKAKIDLKNPLANLLFTAYEKKSLNENILLSKSPKMIMYFAKEDTENEILKKTKQQLIICKFELFKKDGSMEIYKHKTKNIYVNYVEILNKNNKILAIFIGSDFLSFEDLKKNGLLN